MNDCKDCEQYCSDNTCCTCRNREWYRLYEDYKRKEQECEELGQAYLETNELLQEKTKECTNLKVKNEELKKTNKANAISFLKFWFKFKKYKQTLEEIKSLCYEQDLNEDFFACEILQKISECEVE